MTTRIGGFRRKSRHKMSKPRDLKGKISIQGVLQEFNMNDKVYLKADPTYQKGMYNLRFHGACGKVVGKKGSCYEIMIKHMNAQRKLIVHPVHLKKVA